MGKQEKIATVILVLGVGLSAFAFYSSWSYGYEWLVVKPFAPWHMNNWIVVPCWVAYSVCGVLFLWLGSLLFGVALSGGFFYWLFTKLRWKKAFAVTIAFIVLFLVGYNTMDYLCGWIFANNGVPSTELRFFFGFPFESWTYYFLFVILPLACSGFMVSFPSLWLRKLRK